jgi:outer membrane lipoprotein SlyB
MGTGAILAQAPGALLGGVVLCAMEAKMLHRSAEKVKMAKKIESDVDTILVYYCSNFLSVCFPACKMHQHNAGRHTTGKG